MKKKTEHQPLNKHIEELRRRNFHRLPSLRVKNEEKTAIFIDKVGFCLLFPLDGVGIPSLYDAACGGERSLMAGWSKTMQKLWTWKDEIAAKRKAFFGKFFKGRPSFISLEMLPYYYTLSGNNGGLEDYEDAYEEGRITQDAKRVCDLLLEKGPTPTVFLRREAGFRGKGGGYRFQKSLKELECSLLVANVGVYAGSSAWPSIIVDLLPRIFPKEVKKSFKITQESARMEILRKYFEIMVIATSREINRLLGWKKELIEETLRSLLRERDILIENGNSYLSSQFKRERT